MTAKKLYRKNEAAGDLVLAIEESIIRRCPQIRGPSCSPVSFAMPPRYFTPSRNSISLSAG